MTKVDLLIAELKKLGFEVVPTAKPILCSKGTEKEQEKWKFQLRHEAGFSGQLWLPVENWTPPAPPAVAKGVLPDGAEWVLVGDEVVAAKSGKEYPAGTQYYLGDAWHTLTVTVKAAPAKPAAPKKPAPPKK